MLDGTLCASCGVYLEDGMHAGFPEYCEDCEEDDETEEEI
jgi:hypothetical protein